MKKAGLPTGFFVSRVTSEAIADTSAKQHRIDLHKADRGSIELHVAADLHFLDVEIH